MIFWRHLFFVFLVSACSTKHQEIEISPVTRDFIKSEILKEDGERVMLFFMFPDFCGSCTSTVVQFIQSLKSPGFSKIFIAPNESRHNEKLRRLQNINFGYTSNEILRHGIKFPYNQLFLLIDGAIVYHTNIQDSNLEVIKKDIASFE